MEKKKIKRVEVKEIRPKIKIIKEIKNKESKLEKDKEGGRPIFVEDSFNSVEEFKAPPIVLESDVENSETQAGATRTLIERETRDINSLGRENRERDEKYAVQRQQETGRESYSGRGEYSSQGDYMPNLDETPQQQETFRRKAVQGRDITDRDIGLNRSDERFEESRELESRKYRTRKQQRE